MATCALIRHRKRDGQAVVELALTLPLLLILLSAILHYGVLYYTLIGLHSSVTAAASYAAANPGDNNGIIAAVKTSFPPTVNADTAAISIISNGSRTTGDPLTIAVQYDVLFLKNFPFAAIIPAPTKVFSIVTFPIVS